jgi:quercetin dioxygenase-like cupin family protein
VFGALLGAAATGALLAPAASAQRVVPVHEEPRHRLIQVVGHMTVLDVQIQPGDTTLFHTHRTPITYVTIGTSSTDSRSLGGEWAGTPPRSPPPGTVGTVRAVLSYAEAPFTHQVTTVGSTLFRLIAIPSAGPGRADGGEAMPGEDVGESRWFRYRRVSLPPGEETDWYVAGAPIAVVAVRDARVWIDRGDEWASTLDLSGDVGVLEPGVRYRLRNRGSTAGEVVLVEAR